MIGSVDIGCPVVSATLVDNLRAAARTSTGEPVAWRLSDNVVGLTLEDLRRIPNVIGVAGGADKHAAILGALRARLMTVLITDEATANHLISEAGPTPPVAPGGLVRRPAPRGVLAARPVSSGASRGGGRQPGGAPPRGAGTEPALRVAPHPRGPRPLGIKQAAAQPHHPRARAALPRRPP